MKKRIISLILVVVMTALVLTGCAYSYTKDDMSSYAKFEKEKFEAALQSLVIEDADFGTDEDARQTQVLDAIFTTLAGQADTDAKVTTGVPAKYATYYYCYYCTATFEGEEVFLYATNMKESGATKLQLGMSTLEGLDKKIADLVSELDITEYVYKTSTSDAVAAGNTVFVSYVKEYEAVVLDDEGNPEKDDNGADIVETKKVTVTNEMVVIPEGEGESFLHKLVGVKAGATATKFDDVKEQIDGEEKSVDYSSVKVNWLATEMNEAGTVVDVTYDEKKEVKDVFGDTYDLKDVELTYHIYPVYYLDVVSELTAEVVIADLLGDDITTDTLDCFKNEDYKNGDESLETIIEKLAELQAALTTAKDDTEDAQDSYDEAKETVETAGDSATNAQKTTLSDAEKKLKEAKEAEAEAQKKVDDQIAKIWDCGEDIEEVIVKEYKEYRYESLEDTYKDALKQSLAAEIYSYAKKYVTFERDSDGWWILPRKAVNEAYDRLMNNYKYDFYEGNYSSSSSSSSSSSTVTNYSKYEGDFDAFLKAELGLKTTDDKQAIYDAIGKQAEDSVKELIVVYTLAELYGDAVAVTDEDKEEFKQSFQYILLVYQVGEDNVHESDFIHAIQLDNILNYLLTEKEDYEGNTVQYEHIKYEFKSEAAEEE